MGAIEVLAEHLRTTDRFRRGHRLYQADRIEVSHRSPVKVVAHRVDGEEKMPEAEDLSLGFGEIIQVVEA